MPFNAPTLKVEIAFDDPPLTASPTWTDVSAYVRDTGAMRITRGRPTELDTFSAGQCTFTLDNRDARFSPLNASSPYNGDLLPGKQVRVSATWSAVDYVMFRGFIVGWPQRYTEGKKDAIVPIVAYDALSKLQDMELTERLYDYMANDVGSLERLYRGYANRQWTDIVGGRHATYSMGIVGAGEPDVVGAWGEDDLQCAYGRLVVAPDQSGTTTGSISFWLKTSTPGSSSTSFNAILSAPQGGFTQRQVIGINSAGKLRFLEYDIVPTFYGSLTSVDTVADGALHHVVVTGNGKIIVDGNESYTGAIYGTEIMYWQQIGADPTDALDFNFVGELQDLAFFSVNLTEAQARTIYQMGTGTYTETTAACAGAILDIAGWPAGLRALASNTYGNISYVWPEGTTALEALQMVARTEQGRMFMSRTGNVTLLSRYSHELDSAAVNIQQTFSDDGSDANYRDIGFDFDDRQVRNDLRLSTVARLSSNVEDATSIGAYGRQTYSITNALSTQDEVTQMALGLLDWYKDPQVRSLPMVTNPQLYSGSWATILGLDLGHRVRFEITAPGAGSQAQQSLLLEQADWDVEQAEWVLTVQGSPVPSAVGIYDTDTYDGGAVYAF